MKPCKTPSYSATHQAQNYVQNIYNRFGAVAVPLRLLFQFTKFQYCSGVEYWYTDRTNVVNRFDDPVILVCMAYANKAGMLYSMN